MLIRILESQRALGEAAARHAAESISHAIADRGCARIIAATGASQFDFLDALVRIRLDWPRVEMFHLDEYAGLPEDHPASFRKYLRERLVSKTGIQTAHFLDGANTRQVAAEIQQAPVDVAFVGIGENGHLAFNDPPADFDTEDPYILVHLDDACRRQQVGEDWFQSVDEVPQTAVSMSIRQILKSREILCIVPEARKAEAVRNCLQGAIDPMFPASILRTHPNTTIFLDRDSAALLEH